MRPLTRDAAARDGLECGVIALLAIGAHVCCAVAAERPALAFREDFKETPAALPITAEHIANPNVVLSLHGPGKDGLKKSHHDQPADDPYYLWSGECKGTWAATLRHKSGLLDLTGQAKVRWRAKQSGFRQLRIVVQLADNTWLVSDVSDPPSSDWREVEFNIADVRWRRLNIDTIVEGNWAAAPDLRRVREIGVTDLMPGGGTPASSRLDWIEIHAGLVKAGS